MKQLLVVLITVLLGVSVAAPAAEWRGPQEVLRAAKAGDADAQLEMGILYEYGFFMPDHRPPALAWYILSAQQGNAKAARHRDRLQQKMNPSEISRAQELLPTLVSAQTRRQAPAPAAPESQDVEVQQETEDDTPEEDAGQQ